MVQARFDNHEVLRLKIDEQDEAQRNVVNALRPSRFNVDFWSDSGTVDIRVTPDNAEVRHKISISLASLQSVALPSQQQ